MSIIIIQGYMVLQTEKGNKDIPDMLIDFDIEAYKHVKKLKDIV